MRQKVKLKKFDGTPIFAAPVIKPATFYVLLKPKAPKTSIGVIALSKRTRKAQQAVCTMGQIVAIGDLAWKAGTDLDYSKCSVVSNFKVGDHVVYRQHTGQKQRYGEVKSADELDEFLLIVADSDIMGHVPAGDVDKFYDWAG